MGVYKRGKFWWYKFSWKGETVRESTRRGHTAGQMEAVRRTQLAKGEAGIGDHKSPTVARFIRESFVPFVETSKSGVPNTLLFYRRCVKNLLAWPNLANCKLTEVDHAKISAYIVQRQEAGRCAATINHELATLRRALRLANEWGDLPSAPPKIRLLNGEKCRERVLTSQESHKYLNAAEPLLRAVATIMLDCGLRPDEVYRLKWHENYRDGLIVIHTGKPEPPAEASLLPVTLRHFSK